MIDDVLTKKDNECASRVEAAEREGQAAIARLEAMLAAEEVAASRAHEAAESLERNLCRLQSKHDALQQAFADVKQQLADEVVGREQTEDTLEAVTEELERRTRAHSQLDVEFHKLFYTPMLTSMEVGVLESTQRERLFVSASLDASNLLCLASSDV